MKALGWSIGQACVSTINIEGCCKVGDRGKVIGAYTNPSDPRAAEEVLVEFANGKRVNILAKTQIITVAEHVRRPSRLLRRSLARRVSPRRASARPICAAASSL